MDQTFQIFIQTCKRTEFGQVGDCPFYKLTFLQVRNFYYPWISRRMAIESKLRFAQLYSRLPFRDLYFFLGTPIETAMERIYRRISDDHPEITYGRDYWLHLHEHEESLRALDQKFRMTLQVAQLYTSFKIIEIDTAKQNEEQVSELISEHTIVFHKGDSFEPWKRI